MNIPSKVVKNSFLRGRLLYIILLLLYYYIRYSNRKKKVMSYYDINTPIHQN